MDSTIMGMMHQMDMKCTLPTFLDPSRLWIELAIFKSVRLLEQQKKKMTPALKQESYSDKL